MTFKNVVYSVVFDFSQYIKIYIKIVPSEFKGRKDC